MEPPVYLEIDISYCAAAVYELIGALPELWLKSVLTSALLPALSTRHDIGIAAY